MKESAKKYLKKWLAPSVVLTVVGFFIASTASNTFSIEGNNSSAKNITEIKNVTGSNINVDNSTTNINNKVTPSEYAPKVKIKVIPASFNYKFIEDEFNDLNVNLSENISKLSTEIPNSINKNYNESKGNTENSEINRLVSDSAQGVAGNINIGQKFSEAKTEIENITNPYYGNIIILDITNDPDGMSGKIDVVSTNLPSNTYKTKLYEKNINNNVLTKIDESKNGFIIDPLLPSENKKFILWGNFALDIPSAKLSMFEELNRIEIEHKVELETKLKDKTEEEKTKLKDEIDDRFYAQKESVRNNQMQGLENELKKKLKLLENNKNIDYKIIW